MASEKTVKRRIRSAKNIKQITKAMEMVSAAKMRRSQSKALTTRPYSSKLQDVLSQLSDQIDPKKHPMLRLSSETTATIGIILISSDRGLCGALNTNLFRVIEEFKMSSSAERKEEVLSYEYIAVGKKAREYVLKTGQVLHAEFTNFPEKPSFNDVLPVSRLAIEGYMTKQFKEIYVVYTDFISTLKQEVNSIRILPIETKVLEDVIQKAKEKREYIFEPSADKTLDYILPHYIEMQIFQTILEAQASEHSARMVSMRNASDNATEIISEFTLIYNKQRQQAITREISDLVVSREALS